LVAFADEVIELITFHCAPVAAYALVWNWHEAPLWLSILGMTRIWGSADRIGDCGSWLRQAVVDPQPTSGASAHCDAARPSWRGDRV